MTRVRFCSSCGAELPSRPPTTCMACDTSHWRNAKPCANAIVAREGEVLLARRAYAPWRGLWATPGGFCELGEHPIETVERETREETGLAIEVTGYLGTWVEEYADERGHPDAEIINVAYYLATPLEGEAGPFDPAEVSELGWFAWDALPGHVAPPGTLEAILRAARHVYEAGAARAPLPDRPERRR